MSAELIHSITAVRAGMSSGVEKLLGEVNSVLSELPIPADMGFKYFFDKEGVKQVKLFQTSGGNEYKDILSAAEEKLNTMLVHLHSIHFRVTLRWVTNGGSPAVMATDLVLDCYTDKDSISQMADHAKDLMPRATPEKVEATHQ
jgi:hypothetical protein